MVFKLSEKKIYLENINLSIFKKKVIRLQQIINKHTVESFQSKYIKQAGGQQVTISNLCSNVSLSRLLRSHINSQRLKLSNVRVVPHCTLFLSFGQVPDTLGICTTFQTYNVIAVLHGHIIVIFQLSAYINQQKTTRRLYSYNKKKILFLLCF